MVSRRKIRSLSLSSLFLFSLFFAFVLPSAPVSAAVNETSEGIITGTETWSGSHSVIDDITIATGAKLVIQPGTSIQFSNGSQLVVRGSLCAGESACGSDSDATSSSAIQFSWSLPADPSATGDCYGITQGSQEITVDDPSCGEGVVMMSTVDLSQTAMRYVDFDGPWGVPHYISAVSEFRYAALVLDGASPILTGLTFSGVNTSSVLTTDLAQPTFDGGTFVVGSDNSKSVVGSAIQVYSSGSLVKPFVISDIVLSGTNNGCENNDGGRPTLWAEKSFIEIENAQITTGDFGIGLWSSAGSVTNSVIEVNCNGLDVNGAKSVGSATFDIEISSNEITSGTSGITVYNGGVAKVTSNDIEVLQEGSGISVQSSSVEIHDNEIGPVAGWNGLYLTGSFDVIAENNTIFQTAREPVVAGRYAGNNPSASSSRVFLANNTISSNGNGACSSSKLWDGEFTCPSLHAFMTGVTMYDNQIISTGDADGIRAIGSLLDIQRNSFTVSGAGAIIKHYDTGYADIQQYGSLGFFSENTWTGVQMSYNVSKSSVTVQSETIPLPPSGADPVRLSWPDQEAYPGNQFQGNILPTPVRDCTTCKDMTPRSFPLAVEMDNNSTVFTFASLTNLGRSNIKIDTQPTPFAVQVSRAELVRLQTLINGEKVEGATVFIEDAVGNDLYSIETEVGGYTPWIALPSNFHLDFRGLGGGDNPDGYADDEYEDSCSDGKDNDGDLYVDSNDPNCDNSPITRELSLYRYTAYKFGFGLKEGQFTLDESTHQETVTLENLAPTVSVTQTDGHSFKKVVNVTGSAHDGILANSYPDDESAQWDQGGYVHLVQVKDPFTGSWENAGLATDTSGSPEGHVDRFNRPFSSWYFEIDLSQQAVEDDYVFEFRAFDGIAYSSIVTREFKLNTQAPTIIVDAPVQGQIYDEDILHFEGSASDYYGCNFSPVSCNIDISSIHILIESDVLTGPIYFDFPPISDDGSWLYDYSVANILPKQLAFYTVTVWAADSDFCQDSSGAISEECNPYSILLTIDQRNSIPTIDIDQPRDGEILSSAGETVISGIARDFDPDGVVTRVDIDAFEVTAGGLNLVKAFSAVPDQESGNWEVTWDTTKLKHNKDYLIRARSYDGVDYSNWMEATFTADNPPDKDNSKPVFSSDGWEYEIQLYCDTDSSSANRCTQAEIDLNDFFSDIDGDIQWITVYDDTSIEDDDDHSKVVIVDPSGIARYNPYSMDFYDSNIESWTLEAVTFVAEDFHGSKAMSEPVSFLVNPLQFNISEPDENWVTLDEIAVYSGSGLPGKQVSVTIGGVPVNTTVVSADGTWELGIPGSRLSDGSYTPYFSYSGQDIDAKPISLGEPQDGGTSNGTIALIGIITIAILSIMAYFFIELEVDESQTKGPINISQEQEDSVETEEHQSSLPPITQDSENMAKTGDFSDLERHEDHPGWLWNPSNQEWVPDPDFD